MSENWKTYKIEDISSKISIGPFGSRMKSDCYVNDGVPVIRGKNLGERPDFISDFVYITEKKADELLGCNVFKGDLVFPHRGAIGEVGLVTKDERFVLSSSLMKLSCDITKADPRFVYYFFKSDIGKRKLLLNESQVGTPGIGQPLSSLRDIDIILPPLPEQRAIASILSAIDDKIELNLQMNKTLEEMAMALYKHWFVDFGPFQDGEFVDSELGMIPKGWEVKRLDSLASFKNGKGLKNEDKKEDGLFSVYGSNGIIGRTNEILFDNPVIAIGRVGANYGEVHYSIKPCWISDNAVTVQPINQRYFWWLLQQLRLVDYSQFVAGSAQPLITQGAIKLVDCAVPNEDVLIGFSDRLNLLFCQLQNNVDENQTLTILRDTLLPKLISGEIRVKDAEKTLATML